MQSWNLLAIVLMTIYPLGAMSIILRVPVQPLASRYLGQDLIFHAIVDNLVSNLRLQNGVERRLISINKYMYVHLNKADKFKVKDNHRQQLMGSETALSVLPLSLSKLTFYLHATIACSNLTGQNRNQNTYKTKILSRSLHILHSYADICWQRLHDMQVPKSLTPPTLNDLRIVFIVEICFN